MKSNRFVVTIVVLALVLSACSQEIKPALPTYTPYPTYTPVPAATSTAAPTVVVSHGSWKPFKNVSAIDDSVNSGISLLSESGTEMLYIRCNRAIDVYVATGEFIDAADITPRSLVTIRLDKESPETYKWDISTNNTSLFEPDPQSFMTQIFSHKTLAIQYTPYNDNSRIAIFDLAGAKETYDTTVGKQCN